MDTFYECLKNVYLLYNEKAKARPYSIRLNSFVKFASVFARWYVGDMSRQRAESLLKQEDKEGCFVVRNSSTKGLYTLSLYTKVWGPWLRVYGFFFHFFFSFTKNKYSLTLSRCFRRAYRSSLTVKASEYRRNPSTQRDIFLWRTISCTRTRIHRATNETCREYGSSSRNVCMFIFILFLIIVSNLPAYLCSPHPHVKHYHIKQNTRGEFYLSEKHCCGSIPDLVNYHRHNSGGLASRLKTSPCDRPVPPTAGLSHG